MNLNLYKYFYEVAKYQSFTKASEELLVSQPSLSYSIKTLEEQLGYKLFNRENNKIILTKEGSELKDRIGKALEILEDSGTTNEISGKLTIGVRLALSIYTVSRFINKIGKVHPNLEIDLKVLEQDELLPSLKNGKVDVIVDVYEHNGEFKSIEINESNIYLYTTPAVIEEIKESNVEDVLKKKTFYMVKDNRMCIDFIEMYKDCGYKYDYSQTTPIAKNKAIENDGILVSINRFVRNEIEANKLAKIESEMTLPKANLYIAYNKNYYNKKIEALIKSVEINEYN